MVILIALGIRLAPFCTLPWDDPDRFWQIYMDEDAHEFHNTALLILNDGLLSTQNPDLFAHRTKGYPLFLVSIYALFGTDFKMVGLFQILLDVALLFIVYQIAYEIFASKWVSLLAAFLHAVNVMAAYLCSLIISESLFCFVFSLSILVFIRSIKKNSLAGFAVTGLLVGVSTAIKPIIIYFVPVLLVPMFLARTRYFQLQTANRMNTDKPVWPAMLVLTAVFLISLAPWQLIHYFQYGHYSLSNIQGTNLCQWNMADLRLKMGQGKDRVELAERYCINPTQNIPNPFDRAAVQQKIGMNFISKHPLEYLQLHFWGIRRMMFAPMAPIYHIFPHYLLVLEKLKIRDRSFYYFYRRYLMVEPFFSIAFILIGILVMLINKKTRLSALLFILMLFYFINITGTVGNPRYKIPFLAITHVIIAGGLYGIAKFGLAQLKGLPFGKA